MTLHIGYDAKRIVSNGTGLGAYCRTLVNDLVGLALRNTQLHLYAPKHGREELRNQLVTSSQIQFHYPSSQLPLYPAYWRRHGIVKALKADNIQLFHGLSGELPSGLRKADIPAVVTIHDLIFLRHPEYYNPIDVWLYKQKFHATLREADRIIAISECTKRDILEYGNYPEEKIEVIYQSCQPRFAAAASDAEKERVKAKYELPSTYILNVGTIEPRKNVALVVEALPQLPEDVALIIVGRPTKYADEVKRLATSLGVAARVHFLHGVPNEDLPALYQQAACFAYPSRYEGFGIPIIEAIQGGLPVVACTGSCLEEAGGPDNLYVHPDDAEAMASTLQRALYDEAFRCQSVVKSRNYVRKFENNSVAKQVWALYQSLVKL